MRLGKAGKDDLDAPSSSSSTKESTPAGGAVATEASSAAASSAAASNAAASSAAASNADNAAEAEQDIILVMKQNLETFTSNATSAEKNRLSRVLLQYHIRRTKPQYF